MRKVVALALVTYAAVIQGQSVRMDASRLSTSEPAAIAELDLGKLNGSPLRLAWAPDGDQLYVQTAETGRTGDLRRWHYVVAATGGLPRRIDSEPPWAERYWSRKATQAAPGAPALKIELDEQRRVISSITNMRGAGVAGLGGDTYGTSAGGRSGDTGDAVAGGPGSQNAVVRTMRLKGEIIGEWINTGIIPGQTFGWAPPGTRAIAFVNREGRVVVMDGEGRKHEVPGTKDALLPAWTDEGTRVAYLERKRGKKLSLNVFEVQVDQ